MTHTIVTGPFCMTFYTNNLCSPIEWPFSTFPYFSIYYRHTSHTSVRQVKCLKISFSSMRCVRRFSGVSCVQVGVDKGITIENFHIFRLPYSVIVLSGSRDRMFHNYWVLVLPTKTSTAPSFTVGTTGRWVHGRWPRDRPPKTCRSVV